MRIWIAIVVIWAAYAATGAVPGVSVPWLVTIGCWAFVDLAWHLSGREIAPAGSGRDASMWARILTYIPHLLYCLPLADVPILGFRLLPPLSSVRWAGAAMCVAGAGFGICARRVLGKRWSGDVAIAPAHALVQRGPYAIVRHPIYLGFLLAQLGMIITLGEVRALIFVYGIDRLMKKLPLEEAALRKEYPMEYEQYSRRVRKLVPFVW
ncbi:MAG: isoprenylcysteine carboxylmethyltransferase family protein [Paludisphaera borealis]|uniref:methyltransferase family protein n=1 Tax=Paludisphaera borealis TaxID=1387353 RepID=UPI0028463A3A|nr:isoprenylcysteine carboxylmethyltransferase family protein [Paludisphaera borealis]MDR3622527.1 isoprenylcysteine carboxylmethyltransferase family protein [Paludisphaera borealis]